MLPLYKRLSELNLLRRCVMGLTQNQNESFNATVWKKCPKEKRLGAASVERALNYAVITWNSGKLYVKMLEKMNIQSNWSTENLLRDKNVVRVKSATRKTKKSDNIKKKRIENVTAEQQKRQKMGVDYVPGGH